MNSENSKQSSNSVFLWFIFIIPFYFRSASQFYSIYDPIQEVLISPPISVYHLSFSSLPLMQRHIYSETSLETNHGLCILERTKMMSNVSMNERGCTLLCGRHPVCFFFPSPCGCLSCFLNEPRRCPPEPAWPHQVSWGGLCSTHMYQANVWPKRTHQHPCELTPEDNNHTTDDWDGGVGCSHFFPVTQFQVYDPQLN